MDDPLNADESHQEGTPDAIPAFLRRHKCLGRQLEPRRGPVHCLVLWHDRHGLVKKCVHDAAVAHEQAPIHSVVVRCNQHACLRKGLFALHPRRQPAYGVATDNDLRHSTGKDNDRSAIGLEQASTLGKPPITQRRIWNSACRRSERYSFRGALLAVSL
ncbi:hypothetical protein MHUMG1_03182 [Metarhizium humberi]|uniref:Uncharacterized protein n=1 Tax=Metarhizium humberi TaxID=2596975 RepID=A0A9P8MFN5_9HYPO|nr:hypothetical protein MHUMG1_03182 [Metarhizium humberi]